MRKEDLIRVITDESGLHPEAVRIVVEKFMKVVSEAVASGDSVLLRGFGCFERVRRAEKTARNIGENTEIIIPAHFTPKFRPYPDFKNLVMTTGGY